MRKLIVSMHVTLDGFVAGPNGAMNWIKFDNELFDFVGKMTAEADIALYGRVTHKMMEDYWPTAGDKPNASKHDIEHSKWYKESLKVVLSTTMGKTNLDKTIIIGDEIPSNIQKLKESGDKNILIFGSPSATHSLFNEGLIDELWLFINPVVIGEGIPMFKGIKDVKKLLLIESRTFNCGVIGLNYSKNE